MSDRPIDKTVQELGSSNSDRAGTAPAEDAFRREYIADAATPVQDNPKPNSTIAAPTGKAPVTGSAPEAVHPAITKDTTAQPASPLSLAQQRTDTERQEFTKRFQHDNFTIDHFQPGWGPYQALQQMNKDKKVTMTPDEIRDTSRAIRDRDFSQAGKTAYKTTDTTSRWTQPEMNALVETAVSRPKGIDVAHGNGDIDWSQVKAAGYSFAFIKASEGITFVDPAVTQNTEGALKAGLKVGFYHYFHPEDAVDKQVTNFVSSIGKTDTDILRLVVDVEDPALWKPYTTAQRAQMIDSFCQEVKKETGVVPSITVYGSPDFFNTDLANSPLLAKYDLWIADYDVAQPKVPKPWTGYQFWQYSETGAVPGIKGNVDLDMYNGTAIPQ